MNVITFVDVDFILLFGKFEFYLNENIFLSVVGYYAEGRDYRIWDLKL